MILLSMMGRVTEAAAVGGSDMSLAEKRVHNYSNQLLMIAKKKQPHPVIVEFGSGVNSMLPLTG